MPEARIELAIDIFFQGNGHVVYDKSFFYNPFNRPTVLRYDLYASSDHQKCKQLSPECEMQLPCLEVDGQNYLYTRNFTYTDFNVDENGKICRQIE